MAGGLGRLRLAIACFAWLAGAACGGSGAPAAGPGAGADAAPAEADVDAAERDSATLSRPPAFCVAPKRRALQEVRGTPAGPYFVRHPDLASADGSAATVFFFPGGPGTRDTAQASFDLWLGRGRTLGGLRVVVPYSASGDLPSEESRYLAVLDEVIACYGASRLRVHLAGTSNGGRSAFALMLRAPDRFVTLLGAPGVFEGATDARLREALGKKPVFNGAGELDPTWMPLVKATHARLAGLGVDSVYVEFPGQAHILDQSANQEPFFAFWAAH